MRCDAILFLACANCLYWGVIGISNENLPFDYSRISRSSSVGHIPHSILSTARAERHANVTSEKDAAKLQVKKRKTEDAVKKTEVEYYNVCVHAERSR